MAPCHHFQMGRCKRGDACNYEHVLDPNFKRKPCEHFARGTCRRGETCLYSHDQADAQVLDPVSATTQAKFKDWRYNFAKDPRKHALLGPAMGKFWQDAVELVGGDIGLMQDVLKLLAEESGMKIVAELLDQPLEDLTTPQLTRIFTARLLPFFKTITHANVVSSAVSEDRVITIYNYVFGPGGHRGVKLFESVAKYLSSLTLVSAEDEKTVNEEAISSFETSIAALNKLVEVNTTAQVHDGFRPIVENLSALLENAPDTFATRNISRQMKRVQQRLGLGQELPSAKDAKHVNGVRPTFHLARDLPGELSEDGPRHDNDKVDIREISILPTQQEIQSSRTEYLPLADPTQWHFGGLDGLLDRNFRLLREDTIGQLRDAARYEVERLQRQGAHDVDYTNRKRQGARTYVYENVTLDDMEFDPFRGLEFVFGFDQLRHLGAHSKKARQEWWQGSKRLGADALICILTPEGSAVFFVVAAAPFQSRAKDDSNNLPLYDSYNLWEDTDRAHVIARLVNEEDLQPVIRSMTTGETQLSLVEFPGVLLPAFMPTLQAMQRLSHTGEVPFAEILAPVATATNPDRDVEIGPPRYATKPGFEFDLSTITHNDHVLRFQTGANIADMSKELKQNSKLDAGQAEALISSLSRKLALIQGPPGTGKSFTGVEIIRALLANKKKGKLGPILCVTFTNHALDQGLERLLDEGVTQLVRIGGRSKSDRLADLNLRSISRNEEATKTEKSDRWKAIGKMKEESEEINSLLNRLRYIGEWKSIKDHLEKTYPHHARQLFRGMDDDGWQIAGYRENEALKRWLRDGDRRMYRPVRPIEELHEMHLAMMAARERHVLYQSWMEEIKKIVLNRLTIATESHAEAKKDFDRIRTEIDLRILRQANIVGLTTSGLARNLDLLRRLDIKVVVCEEAGEVLEAHLITALLPSVEHAILIGDHEQLRPHVQNYELSVEKRSGAHYALDISLFERLVRPNTLLGQPIPYCTLEIQRRMHPSISNLIRQTVYPRLQDAANVKEYPQVLGFKNRLFWLHHENPEDEGAEAFSTSHTNAFECEMVAAMVSHLVKQGVYRSQDIAVITPYLGQLRKLRNRLAKNFEIVLNERDTEDLAKEGEDEPAAEASRPNTARVNVAKATLLRSLRLATVDNFQGEEAKVIVVSLVRSNKNNNPGFLRTPNRINVLLSRAQHGMYILGNANTTQSVPMWAKVIEMFKESKMLGDGLELCCPRHEDTPMTVKNPEDFVRLSPEAGCQLPCEKMLSCGHACVTKCHSDLLHNAVYCQKPCTRPKPGCNHNCPLPCGAVCHKECQIVVDETEVVLDCGHTKTSLPCYQYQDHSRVVCETPKTVHVPHCDHEVTVPCRVDVHSKGYFCMATCGSPLPCGHSCKKACFQCNIRDDDGEITSTDHGTCKQVCDRDYSTCKHRCTAFCHGKDACPLCEAPCDVKCSHSRCGKKCHEPCTPCAEERCSSHCPHSECKMPCAAPCDWIPCNERCAETLDCGCQCPSVCGEPCPTAAFCQNCASDDVKGLTADLLMFEAYGNLDLDVDPCIFTECGHVFTLSSMDGFMNMGEYYMLDEATGDIIAIKDSKKSFSSDELKSCPECRGSLRNIPRYGRIVRRALLDQSTKRLVTWSNHNRRELAERLRSEQDEMLAAAPRIAKQNINFQGSADGQMNSVRGLKTSQRYHKIQRTRREILGIAKKLESEEKPYQRVRDLVETVRRQHIEPGIASFEFDSTELQLQEHVQAMTLLIRCDLIILADVISVHTKTTSPAQKGELKSDFTANRAQCEALIEEANKSSSFCEAVEGGILWAKFAALDCSVLSEAKTEGDDAENMSFVVDALKSAATAKLRIAEETLNKLRLPSTGNVDGQISDAADVMEEVLEGLVDEVEEVKKMLQEGMSPAEMKMVFKAMATEFRGTGHWYRCGNGHLFTVGECGMPMQLARCPTCRAPVGGHDHEAAEGVTAARDMDERFGNLSLED